MRNTIIYLMGHQGVGKLTVGRIICQMTGAALLDNHLLANPIFVAVANDSAGSIPAPVKAKIAMVRAAVFAAAAEDAPRDLSYVLTDVLLDDEAGQLRYAETLALAGKRAAIFVPVQMTCQDDAEYARRVTDPARAALLKQVDLPRSMERRASRPLLPFVHPNGLALDLSRMSAEQSAEAVLAHIATIVSSRSSR